MNDKIYSIEEIKSIVIPIAEKYHLKAVYLFGSYARGTANASSDIDLILDTSGTEIHSLFCLGEVYNELANAFDKSVDMLTVSSLEQKPLRQSEIRFRDHIRKERIDLYAVA